MGSMTAPQGSLTPPATVPPMAQGTLISRAIRLAELVVLVDGLTRSGKGLMGPILSSLERVEI